MSVEDEVLTIIGRDGDKGFELNQLIDQFRGGRDASELLHLLCSDAGELVQLGTYILGEISFDKYDKPVFIDKLYDLTHHDTPVVRLNAARALFPSLDRSDRRTRSLIHRLREDSNEGVRMVASAAARRLGID